MDKTPDMVIGRQVVAHCGNGKQDKEALRRWAVSRGARRVVELE
jgi:hypothetical protein